MLKLDDGIAFSDIINNVLMGDSLNLLKLIPNNSIDLLLTDPPFNLNYKGRGKFNKFEKFENDNLTEDLHTIFLEDFLKETLRVLKKDSSGYVFTDYRNYPRFYNAIDKFFKIKNCIVWDKQWIGMGQCYRFQHELILYFHKGRGKKLMFEKFNVPDILKAKRVRPLTHPTEKPTDLLKQLITHSTIENDLVLDPFAGSFSTASACKELNRNFICCEIDEEYCKLGDSRLQ